MGKRKTYSESFKAKAVNMVLEEGRRSAEVARELGISSNLLYNWKCRYLENTLEADTRKTSSNNDYLRNLEKEVKRLKEERDILKKAAIFFAGEAKEA